MEVVRGSHGPGVLDVCVHQNFIISSLMCFHSSALEPLVSGFLALLSDLK